MQLKFFVKNRKVWTKKTPPKQGEGIESLTQKHAAFSHKWRKKTIFGNRN